MKASIVPVTCKNLDVVADVIKRFGFPRSERWIKRLLFDPNVPEGRDLDSRGALIMSDGGECVGVYCWTPCSVYLRQERKSAYIGALLGVDRKYSPWMLDVIDRNRTEINGRFAFGNDCATVAAYKFWTRLGVEWGPEECGCLDSWFASTGGFLYLCANHVFRRMHLTVGDRLMRLIHTACRLPNYFVELFMRAWDSVRGDLGLYGNWRYREELGFAEERFRAFWERFLAANEGVISSRDPATLRWKFNDSIMAGTVTLISAESNGAVDGYILLRRYESESTSEVEYSVCDICAVGNDVKCLHDLFCIALRYCRRRMATRLTFVGGMHGKEKWMPRLLHRRIKLACNAFSYSAKDEAMIRAVREDKGWFFGPYDGERCMGYGRYVDL